MLIAIWAMTENYLIGNDNSLPWRIKEDLAHFRKTTLNKDILMGKNTYLSLPSNFDQRNIFILTRDPKFVPEDKGSTTNVINDYKKLIEKYRNNKELDLYVCGGVSIYEQLIPLCDQLIVSLIKGEYTGNKYLKNIDLSPFELKEKVELEKFSINYYDRKKHNVFL